MDFRIYNYLKKNLANNIDDINLLYVYLIEVQSDKELNIFQCLVEARQYNEKVKSTNNQVKAKNKYKDISIEDLLGCQ